MFGFSYSVKENFSFERKEWIELFWTSLAFAFILSFRKWGTGKTVSVGDGIYNLIIALIFVFIAMVAHVALQKVVAIKLGYKATYSYWLNGILVSIFLVFMSIGILMFILPGAVMIEHIPKLRLGKFRYGMNLKDIARVALAGPMAHILIVMLLGILYFAFGRPDLLFSVIFLNLLLAIYSMLPIPKIDLPTRMDAGSDGLGMFFFSRTLYVLVFATILIFSISVFLATSYKALWWLFILAFILGSIIAIVYSVTIEQKG